MTSWSVVAGQLTMPGSSINDKSGLSLGILTDTKQTGITLGCSLALVTQLGSAPDNLEYYSAQVGLIPDFDLCARNTFGRAQKHSNRVMGYRVCQLILNS